MRAITKGRIFGSFALAETDRGFLVDDQFFRLDTGAFVRAIAKRGMAGSTTCAPPIGSGFQFQFDGFFFGWDWIFGHKLLGFFGC